MTDDTAVRLTRLEERHVALGERFDRHLADSARLHGEATSLIRKLDEQARRHELRTAQLFGGIAVLIFLGQLLAPIILRSLGVPS